MAVNGSKVDSFWVSAALFVGSSLLLRYTRCRKIWQEETTMDDTEEEKDNECRWYSQRRREDRLSFHELSEAFPVIRDHVVQSPTNTDDEFGSSELYPTRRNSNWSHFESYDATHDLDTYSSLRRSIRSPSDFAETDSLEGEYRFSLADYEIESSDDISYGKEQSGFRRRSSELLKSIPSGKELVLPEITPDLLPPLGRPSKGRLIRAESLDEKFFPDSTRTSDTSASRLTRQTSEPAAVGDRRRLHSPTSSAPQSDDSGEVQEQNREARANYNARIMPDKVILIRHGQSMGNIDESMYSKTADNAMPLTKLGWQQAKEAGKLLRQSLLHDSRGVHFIVSPYVRTVETFHGIASAWCDPSQYNHIADPDERLKAWYGSLLDLGITWHEDPRIREQDFGNFQVPQKIKQAKADRNEFGAFYYRFPHGESASDVFDRMSTFLDSLWRSFDVNKSRNYVIVTHGISIRVLLTRYFRYTIDQFHLLSNPRNCEIVKLEHDGGGKLRMTGRHDLVCEYDVDSQEKRVAGYKYSKTLRVLPPKYVNKVKIRIQYDEAEGGG